MKVEINLENLFNKLENLLKSIFNDSYDYVCYDEHTEKFFISDTHYDDNFFEDTNIIPLQDLLFEIRILPNKEDIANLAVADINSILSLAVENMFIINEHILTPAGHNLLGYKYSQLTGFEYDYEKSILTLEF